MNSHRLAFGPIVVILWLLAACSPAVAPQATPTSIPATATPTTAPPTMTPVPTATEPPGATPTPDPLASWQTYTSTQYGFAIKYPPRVVLYEQKDYAQVLLLSYIPVCDATTVACLVYPESEIPKTDFSGAAVSVNTLKEAGSAERCTAIEASEPAPAQVINGVTFAAGQRSGAAAGHQSEDRIYRTFRAGVCFEIDLRITTSSRSVNFPGGGFKPFTASDRAAVTATLLQILSTFRFLQ